MNWNSLYHGALMKRQKRLTRGGVYLVFSLLVLSCSGNLPDNDVYADADTLELVFEIGEEFGDSTNTFWSISSADIDDQGRIFVLDDVEASVRIFNLNGAYMQNLTRRGSGPGELQRPSCLTIAPDGRIVISDQVKGGFIVYSDSLDLVEEILLWGDNSPYSFIASTNTKYLVCRYKEVSISNGYILKHTANIYNNNFTELFANIYTDSVYDSNDMSEECLAAGLVFAWFKRINCCCDSFGNVYIAPLDTLEYRVYGWDSLGNQFLSTQLDISPVEKEPEEIRKKFIWNTVIEGQVAGHRWKCSPTSIDSLRLSWESDLTIIYGSAGEAGPICSSISSILMATFSDTKYIHLKAGAGRPLLQRTEFLHGSLILLMDIRNCTF